MLILVFFSWIVSLGLIFVCLFIMCDSVICDMCSLCVVLVMFKFKGVRMLVFSIKLGWGGNFIIV